MALFPVDRAAERTREAAGWMIAVVGGFGVTAVLSIFGRPRQYLAGAWYLLVVVIASLVGGWKAGALAVVAATAGLIWGVLPPRRTFAVDDAADVATLLAFLGMAVVVVLLVRARDEARRVAEARADRAEHLSRLAASLAGASDSDAVIETSLRWCHEVLGARRALLTLATADGRGPREEWWAGGSGGDGDLRHRADDVLGRGPDVLEHEGVVAVRLAAPAGPVGVLVADLGEERVLDGEDADVVSVATAAIANAVARARLLEREQAVADQLQRSLLPGDLPAVPGFRLRTWFHPAQGNVVAGDFVDLVVDGDRWAAILGDACGKGVPAAVAAAAARHTFRAAVLDGRPVPETAALVHRAIAALGEPDMFCTAVMVSGRADRSDLALAVAGHPSPVVVDASGVTSEAGGTGALLGALAEPAVELVHLDLDPGSTLVLYTDGVTDVVGGGIDVAAHLRGATGGALDERLAGLRSPGGADDVAVLAITRSG